MLEHVADLWAWRDDQVMAAGNAVPLGHTDGQEMLPARGALLENMS